MAFTKINAAGIGTTETVTVDGLTVINDGSFGGNLTVSGVITYEDVTNVDSVGLITARNGIVVGSGITLSKDGDIFATGITTVSGNVKVGTGITLSPDGDVFFTGVGTGNGSGLTALNASNLGSGTVPTARLGSGTASSSTFLRGDSTFQTVNTDLVSDTSPQLGGALDTNGNNVDFNDSSGTSVNRARFGDSADLQIHHTSNISTINDSYGDLRIMSDTLRLQRQAGGENFLYATEGGKVSLYYDGSEKFETTSTGASITGQLDLSSHLDMGDSDAIKLGDGDDLQIYHSGSLNLIDAYTNNLQIRNGTSEKMAAFNLNSSVELYHDGDLHIRTHANGAEVKNVGADAQFYITAADGYSAVLNFLADNGDDYADYSRIYKDQSGGNLHFQNYAGGSYEDNIVLKNNGAVELYHDNSLKVQTTSTGMQVVESIKMTEGGEGVNLRVVYENGVGNTASATATVPDCVGGGTVTVTVMHNGNTSITTTKMFPFMARGNSTANLGSEIFSINHLSTASFSVSAATLGVTVTNNTGAHAKVRVTFDITANV